MIDIKWKNIHYPEKKKKKLRLLVLEECERDCKGCCNKDYDLSKLEIAPHSYEEYDEVLLTGGEPMLVFNMLINLITHIKDTSSAKIILYTSKLNKPGDLDYINRRVDGVTLTLHEPKDLILFGRFYDEYVRQDYGSWRLNVFRGVDISPHLVDQLRQLGWDVRTDKEWIPNCPLPEGEEFKRLFEPY
jgi:hypothetical protein